MSRWSNCNIQSDAKCKRPIFIFIECCGFEPAFTNLIEVSQLVLKTVYDDKNDWNVERSTCRTESCHNGKLPCWKATVQAPRMCAVVQIYLWQSWKEVSVDIFHLCRFFSISFMSQYIKDIQIKIKTFSKPGLIIHARQTLSTNAAQTYRYIEIYIYNWQLVRKLNK